MAQQTKRDGGIRTGPDTSRSTDAAPATISGTDERAGVPTFDFPRGDSGERLESQCREDA